MLGIIRSSAARTLTNPVDIKRELDALSFKLTALLRDEIGLFSNGQPAIWKGSQIPIGLKTTGLQVLIQPSKQGDALQVSGGTFENQSWIIELVNFSNDEKLVIAQKKIERGFTTSRQSVYKPATDLGLEQCRCFIYAPRLVTGEQAPKLVESINNKTGNVRLGPADIGAEPAGVARILLDAHTQHENPHTQYLTDADLADRLSGFEPVGSVARALQEHAEEDNPHAQYLTRDEFEIELGEAINRVAPASTDASLADHLSNPNAHPQYATGAQLTGAIASLNTAFNTRIDTKLDFDSNLATIGQLTPQGNDLLIFSGSDWSSRKLTAADIPNLPANKIASGVLSDSAIPAAIARTHLHTQSFASASWYVVHGLGRYPSVAVVDGTGAQVQANVTHHSLNELSVSFARPETGAAHLS